MKTQEQIDILLADAKSGDAGAQNDLGCAYGSGDGVGKNFQTAFMWFMRSAEQGNMYAQYNVGLYYRNGNGVKKNISLAVQWYERSASQGFTKAANALGEIYEKGFEPNDIERVTLVAPFASNPQEAFYWYGKVAERYEIAKFNLARCYELGIGTKINLNKAFNLYLQCQNEAKTIAGERINQMKSSYDYLKDTRMSRVELFYNNPFRILGVYSNEGTKAERAAQSKMLAFTKVGKKPTSPIDSVIPSTIAQYILHWKNRQNPTKIPISGLDINSKIKEYNEIKKGELAKSRYDDWVDFESKDQQWDDLPNREESNINKAVEKLAIDTERIKYSLFWFCCVTEEDKKALQFLTEQKWYEAAVIWENCANFSSLINTSVMQWMEGKDEVAFKNILEVIVDDDYRQEFLSHVCKNNTEITETDIIPIFWDAIYSNFFEYEPTEYWENLVKAHLYSWTEFGSKSLDYLKEIHLAKLKKSLIECLRIAEMKNKDDFEECRQAYYAVIKNAPYSLLCIRRFLGEDDYRYKMLCDDLATKLLNYAIYNNNNNKDWGAPSTSLYLATTAHKFAIDSTLRNRCNDNIKVFSENKKITTSEQIMKNIEKAFSNTEEDLDSVKFEQIKKLIKDCKLYLDCLKTELSDELDEYRNISDNVVNRIINIIVKLCTKKSDMLSAASGKDCLNELKVFAMNTQTRNRINSNVNILSNNSQAALIRGDFGIPDTPKTSYRETMSKSEIKERRGKKIVITSVAVTLITAISYILLNHYNDLTDGLLPVCLGVIVILSIFVIAMWGLELKDDPYNSDIEWMEKIENKLFEIYYSLSRMNVQGGKSYSWPFGMPFALLAIAIMIIRFPIKLITKFATLIK